MIRPFLDLDGWWVASNPEHDTLEHLDDRGIEVGARVRIREKIAGIPGEAIGEITGGDSDQGEPTHVQNLGSTGSAHPVGEPVLLIRAMRDLVLRRGLGQSPKAPEPGAHCTNGIGQPTV
ncbi:hypothetical protein [Actinomadura sp. 6N118]|uniref:hypothetical protein n=1 Tax=Actinomadura sp. 6N118 TaxID=3375151 RepID=UPI0037928191